MARRSKVVLVLLALLPACAAVDDPGEREGLLVVSTVAPIVDLIANVMDGRGGVVGLVPPGVDSHTHDPRPGDARTLTEADLFIANGLFLEERATTRTRTCG